MLRKSREKSLKNMSTKIVEKKVRKKTKGHKKSQEKNRSKKNQRQNLHGTNRAQYKMYKTLLTINYY